MNILLVQPSFKRGEKSYPLGRGYIGSALKKRGHEIFGIDLSLQKMVASKDPLRMLRRVWEGLLW